MSWMVRDPILKIIVCRLLRRVLNLERLGLRVHHHILHSCKRQKLLRARTKSRTGRPTRGCRRWGRFIYLVNELNWTGHGWFDELNGIWINVVRCLSIRQGSFRRRERCVENASFLRKRNRANAKKNNKSKKAARSVQNLRNARPKSLLSCKTKKSISRLRLFCNIWIGDFVIPGWAGRGQGLPQNEFQVSSALRRRSWFHNLLVSTPFLVVYGLRQNIDLQSVSNAIVSVVVSSVLIFHFLFFKIEIYSKNLFKKFYKGCSGAIKYIHQCDLFAL
jgi:hypothetical protein